MRRIVFRPLVRARVLRVALLPLLACLGLVVAGCSTPPPAFTFFTGNGSVQVPPTQYCDVTGLHNCQADGTAATAVSVPDDQVVQISAPESVAGTPWQVAAEYHNGNGNSYVSCSPLFPASQQYAYTVRAPAGDQLVMIVVYESSATVELLPNGNLATLIRGTWVLTNNRNGNPTLPKPGDNLCEQ
ncbi:MAG TPA: DUF2771 family protein [Pseudonocardiaceae bacterium]|nr:DUF2771 family protein [Pseudonocardiaceae bacterium]